MDRRQRQAAAAGGGGGRTGRPLSDRATEQLARLRLAELEERARRQRLGLEPLRAESLSMTFGALMDWWWALKGKNLRSHSARSYIHRDRSR